MTTKSSSPQIGTRSASKYLIPLALIGLLQFYADLAISATTCEGLFSFRSPNAETSASTPLILPSGRIVDSHTYTADKGVIDLFNIFFLKSKEAYLTSTGGEALGNVYRHAHELKKSLSSKPEHPLYKLSEQELSAIVSYSEWDYQTINKYLWNIKKNDKVNEDAPIDEAKSLMLLSAINKLPDHVGQVYRGEIIDSQPFQHALDRFNSIPEVGQVYRFPSFTSTTEGLGATSQRKFIQTSAVVFLIKSKTGKSIKAGSTRTHEEEEVLFRPMTPFRVIKKEIIEVEPMDGYSFNQRLLVYLEEI